MENATQPVPLIELRDIRKRYGGNGTPEVEVLKGVSLPTVRTSCPAASSSGYRSPAR